MQQKQEKMEVLCVECGSVFWIDTEVIAVNNSLDLWCPYCIENIGLDEKTLKRCRMIHKEKYNWGLTK